jgi:hypothetical protein
MCKLNYYGNCNPETEDEEYCIFHRPDKNEEEAEEFWRKFFDRFKPDEEEIEIEGEKVRRFIFNEDLNCSGYVFPKFPEGAEIGVRARPFYYSIFKGKAYFSRATFSKANFSRAKFEEVADFSGATFSEAYFSDAKFEEIADFSLAKFKKSVSFSDARFHDFTNFWRAEFPTLKDDAEDLLSYASFRGAYFEHPERVVFDGIEGKVKISFINADISRVVFRNCSFDFLYDEYLLKNREELEEKLEDLRQPITHMVGISDWLILETLSRELEGMLADLTLDNVLSVIRMLRENFDYYMKYEESGKLFVKEMDLKRAHMLKGGSGKLKIAKRIEWLAYSLYRWTCLYGESISRPLILASAIIIGFGILRAIPPTEALLASLLGGNISAAAEFLRALAGSLAEGIRGSLIDFLQLGRDYGWLNLLERVASAINLATLYISLHRKLERRIRH